MVRKADCRTTREPRPSRLAGSAGSSENVRGEYALNFYWQPWRNSSLLQRLGPHRKDQHRRQTVRRYALGERRRRVIQQAVRFEQADRGRRSPDQARLARARWRSVRYPRDVPVRRNELSRDGLGRRLNFAPLADDESRAGPATRRREDADARGRRAGAGFQSLAWKPDQTKLDTANRFKLSDYRGKKIVVVDMWATWCGPCMKGIPHLSKVAEAVSGQDVVVIALNTSDDQVPFEKFATGKGKEYKLCSRRSQPVETPTATRSPESSTV